RHRAQTVTPHRLGAASRPARAGLRTALAGPGDPAFHRRSPQARLPGGAGDMLGAATPRAGERARPEPAARPLGWSVRLNALPRDSRDALFLLLVIGWVILPQVGNLPLWCSILAGAVLVWRGWLALASRPLPGKWWLLGLLAATVAATFATHRTLLGRDAGVTLIVALLALKTLEVRARRDAFVIFSWASSRCSRTSSSRNRCPRPPPCWWRCSGC